MACDLAKRRGQEVRRLMKTLESFTDGQVCVTDIDWDTMETLELIVSPNAGPYRGGAYRFSVQLDGYSLAPVSKLLHPNISDNNVCLTYSEEESFDLEIVILGILYIMHTPGYDDGYGTFSSNVPENTRYRSIRVSLTGRQVGTFEGPKYIEDDDEIRGFLEEIEQEEKEKKEKEKEEAEAAATVQEAVSSPESEPETIPSGSQPETASGGAIFNPDLYSWPRSTTDGATSSSCPDTAPSGATGNPDLASWPKAIVGTLTCNNCWCSRSKTTASDSTFTFNSSAFSWPKTTPSAAFTFNSNVSTSWPSTAGSFQFNNPQQESASGCSSAPGSTYVFGAEKKTDGSSTHPALFLQPTATTPPALFSGASAAGSSDLLFKTDSKIFGSSTSATLLLTPVPQEEEPAGVSVSEDVQLEVASSGEALTSNTTTSAEITPASSTLGLDAGNSAGSLDSGDASTSDTITSSEITPALSTLGLDAGISAGSLESGDALISNTTTSAEITPALSTLALDAGISAGSLDSGDALNSNATTSAEITTTLSTLSIDAGIPAGSCDSGETSNSESVQRPAQGTILTSEQDSRFRIVRRLRSFKRSHDCIRAKIVT